MRRWPLLPAIFVAWVLTPATTLSGADFLRGDVNWDGRVSTADAQLMVVWLFHGYQPDYSRLCESAMDADGNGSADLKDVVRLIEHVVLQDEPLVAPYPGIGPESVSGSSLSCEEFGSLPPLEDESARLRILDATAAGGTSRLARITLAGSMSRTVAALYFELGYPAGLLDALDDEDVSSNSTALRELWIPEPPDGRLGALMANDDDSLRLAATYIEPGAFVPPGEDVPLVEIAVCLSPGTPAGEYPLTLLAAEFTSGEFEGATGGRAILPERLDGTLTVLSDVPEDADDCDPNPPTPPPPPVVTFALGDAEGSRGESVNVPFAIEANVPSQGFTFSVDFDEDVLTATEVVRLWSRPSGTPFEFIHFDVDNERNLPGNQGVFEGYITGAAIISLTDTDDVLPPGESVDVLACLFEVNEDAPLGTTEVTFVDGGVGGDGAPVANKLIAGGKDFTPDTADSFVFVSGSVNIVPPDGIPFLRGDSNLDSKVDVSDPINTLKVLFLGEGVLSCPDAADANDNGSADLADAVFTLEALFLGTRVIPQPYPIAGSDPTTDDPLRCLPVSATAD